MPAPTYTVPTNNADTSTEEPKITIALSDLKSLLTGGLDTDNMAASAKPATLMGAYRVVKDVKGFLATDAAAATYLLGTNYSALGAGMAPSASSIAAGPSAAVPLAPELLSFDDADYAVSGLTPKLRIKAAIGANATAPGINFTFRLAAITVAGAADNIAFTVGSTVSGSDTVFNTPSASTITTTPTSGGTDFTVPADGAYALWVVTSGTLANNSMVACHAQLQLHHTT